jgi:hypothetical protein
MKSFLLSEIKLLIEIARPITKVGHAALDWRYENDGDNIDGRGRRNSHYRRPYYKLCHLISKTYQPNVIVELGIDEGDCCGHWAFGCPTTQVYGIDVHKDWDWPSKCCQKIEQNFSNFHYLRGWTWDRLKDIVALNKPIDVLYIDSWHEADYLIRDWNDYHKLLRKGSLVLVDDLQMSGLGNVFEKFPGEKFVDISMNSACPIGIMIYNGTSLDLPFNKRDFMP